MIKLLYLIPFFLFSCHTAPKIIEAKPDPIPVQTNTCESGVQAIIKPFQLDGCTWVIELSDGEKIEPMNYRDYLTESELEAQLPVRIKAEFRDTKSPTICMIGRTVAISCLERLK